MTITRSLLAAALAAAMLTAAATPAYAPEGDGRDRHVVRAASAACDPVSLQAWDGQAIGLASACWS